MGLGRLLIPSFRAYLDDELALFDQNQGTLQSGGLTDSK
jgi:hypothetical protein